MPFTPSSDASFEPDVGPNDGAYRVNTTWDDKVNAAGFPGAIFRNAMYDAFQAYMARDDIESRDSILVREQATPGGVFWANAVNGDAVATAGDEAES